jgi:hypothetical protein
MSEDTNREVTSADESLDLLPEFCVYQDEGCELAASCLECPYPRCIEELPRGRSKWTRKYRDREILRLHLKKKMPVRDIASRLNISIQTVYNVIYHQRGERK